MLLQAWTDASTQHQAIANICYVLHSGMCPSRQLAGEIGDMWQHSGQIRLLEVRANFIIIIEIQKSASLLIKKKQVDLALTEFVENNMCGKVQ